MKGIRIAKYNMRGDVIKQCHRHVALEGEMRIVSVSKKMLGVHALNFVTSLVILRLAFVGRRSCRRYVRNTLRNGLVRCFAAILTHPPVLPFQIIIIKNENTLQL